jgi:hypothetical protein
MFPRINPGYAELTIERRQVGADRADLRLARWFSSAAPPAGDDDIFSAEDNEHPTIRFVQWDRSEDFQEKLLDVLAQELRLADSQDVRGFNRALGCTTNGQYDNFNRGAVEAVERWQLLSPLRGMPFGVGDINRLIHERFRATDVTRASYGSSTPRPLGPERIVYGDKVINLSNHARNAYPNQGAVNYLANGEIGLASGVKNKNFLNVEFSSQMGWSYGFSGRDFGDEHDPRLELAYALTIHKAQGSQFGLVILVLPEEHPILSRELIYTALTRHQNKVVVMYQGPRSRLREFTSPYRSEIARRRTNLLDECRMVEVQLPRGSAYFQDRLIHRTSRGFAVRSRAELLIAEALISAGVSFAYEKELLLSDKMVLPDFTIEDEVSGRTVYWEHLGMLDRADYRARWEWKLGRYLAHGILPYDDPAAGAAVLLTTEEVADGSFDMVRITRLIQEVCGG